jgi:hypothetical protein
MVFALTKRSANSLMDHTSCAKTINQTPNTKLKNVEFTCKKDSVCTGRGAISSTHTLRWLERGETEMQVGSR